MTDETPQWALERAAELARELSDTGTYSTACVNATCIGRAFARYIAKHEEKPIDPLLKEAREIAGKYYAEESCPSAADKCRSGEWDNMAPVKWRLEGLRRGIELGKAGAA